MRKHILISCAILKTHLIAGIARKISIAIAGEVIFRAVSRIAGWSAIAEKKRSDPLFLFAARKNSIFKNIIFLCLVLENLENLEKQNKKS